ncbi:MAG TPA: Gmad2 immunoglobulin-like domain-containing protein, partial [Acidimicrobiia bacterium]
RPGFLEFNGVSTGQEVIVAVDPPSESEVNRVTTFSGYTRAFESMVTVIVTQGDAVITETSTTAADSTDAWGEFEIELTLPPGPIEVFLGEANPEDGSLSGVILDLTAS